MNDIIFDLSYQSENLSDRMKIVFLKKLTNNHFFLQNDICFALKINNFNNELSNIITDKKYQDKKIDISDYMTSSKCMLFFKDEFNYSIYKKCIEKNTIPIIEYDAEIADLLDLGRTVEYFTNLQELEEKVQFYSKYENVRIEFLRACKEYLSDLENKIDNFIIDAEKLISNSIFNEAIKILKKLNKFDSNNHIVLNDLGVIAFYEKRYNDAVSLFKKAYALNKNDKNIEVNLSEVHKITGHNNPHCINVSNFFFSVCIFTYNRAYIINETIKSILNQTYDNYEIIIVDDGSTDNTKEVVLSFNSDKIRYIKKEHTNIPDSRNRCIKEAKGDYIIWIGSDDLFSKKILEIYNQELNNYPEIDILSCNLINFNDDNHCIVSKLKTINWWGKEDEVLKYFFYSTPIFDPGCMVKRKVYQQIGYYDINFFRANDFELWSRVAINGCFKIKVVEQFLCFRRLHYTNVSGRLNKITCDFSFELKVLDKILSTKKVSDMIDKKSKEDNELLIVQLYIQVVNRYKNFNDLQNSIRICKDALKTFPNSQELIILLNNLNEIEKDYNLQLYLINKICNVAIETTLIEEYRAFLVKNLKSSDVDFNMLSDYSTFNIKQILLSQITKFSNLKEYHISVNLLHFLLYLMPDNIDICLALAEQYIAIKNYKEAGEILKGIIKNESSNKKANDLKNLITQLESEQILIEQEFDNDWDKIFIQNTNSVSNSCIDNSSTIHLNQEDKVKFSNALNCFIKAQNFLFQRDFNQATQLIQEYRNKINYDFFVKHDNRLYNDKIKVSVVIVAYNTRSDLIKCINSVLPQLKEDAEIIVIDNGKNDEVLDELLSMKIMYVRCPINLNPSEGRNIGAYFAKGKILAFLDDDAIADNNFIIEIIKAFDTFDIHALRGKVLSKNDVKYIKYSKHYNLGDNPFPYYIGTEGNSAVLKDSYLCCGGMDPLLFGAEGAELSYRLVRTYGESSCIYFPSVIIFHDYANNELKLNTKIDRHNLMHQYVSWKNHDYDKYINDFRMSLQTCCFKDLIKKLVKKNENFDNQNLILYEKLSKINWQNKINLYQNEISNIEYINSNLDPCISVIIIAWKFSDEILLNLRALQKQRGQNFELIFVVNGCNDSEFEKFKCYSDVFIKLKTNKGSYLARNIGAIFSNASILLFLDDDAFPNDDLIKNHVDLHKKYDIFALRGKVLPKTTGSEKPAHYDLGDKEIAFYADIEGNTSYKADVFYQVGGWDDEIIMGGGGVDLSIRIFQFDSDYSKQMYSPKPIIYHDFTKNPEWQKKKKLLQDQSRTRLRRKHPIWDRYLQEWNSLNVGIKKLYNSSKDVYVLNKNGKYNDVTASIIDNSKLILFNNDKNHLYKIYYNDLPKNCNHFTAVWLTEPITVLNQNYDSNKLNTYPLVIHWNKKLLKNLSSSLYVPHAHLSHINAYDKIFENTTDWDNRKKEIIFISNPKQSNHKSELYSIRLEVADWFYKNSSFEVSWYSRMLLDRPYYKGAIDNKAKITETCQFLFCPENCYDELYSYDYLTEKIFDAFIGRIVPIYMGCYNIEDYFSNEMFIDLRNFQKSNAYKNVDIDCYKLNLYLEQFTKNDFDNQQNAVKEYFKNNKQMFIDRAWPNVYNTVHKLYLEHFSKIKTISTGYNSSLIDEINRIEKGYIFTGDYYVKKEIEELVKRFNIKSIVETGTSTGNSTLEMSKLVENVYSIEVDKDVFLKTKEKLKDYKNIHLFLGSSEKVLRDILSFVPRPVLFFLDAHWYDYWPILDELKAIGNYRDLNQSIIVIHDFYVPNSDLGYDSYKNQKLDLEYISKDLFSINPNYQYYYNSKALGKKRGVIYIHPPVDKIPLISICIPTYNRANYLAEAIQSALNQNYSNYEIVIVDDGSTDNTEEVVNSFNSEKIRYIRKENEGRPKTRNKLIAESHGDFLLWLDDDDILYPNILQTYSQVLSKENVDVIYCDIEVLCDKTKKIISHYKAEDYTNNEQFILENMIIKSGITFPGSLVRRDIIKKAGFFDETFLRAQDNELWSRLANKAKFYKIKNVLYTLRSHDANISSHNHLYIDQSYESLVIKNILANNPLREIFHSIDWSKKDASVQAYYNIAKGFFRFSDFYSCKNVLELINFIDFTETFLLYLYTLIGLSEFEKAKECINLHSSKLNQKDIEALNLVVNNLLLVYNKLMNNESLSLEAVDFIIKIKQYLTFYPSVFYFYHASNSKNQDERFKYYLKACITSPKDQCLKKKSDFFVNDKKNEIELFNSIDRVLKPITFYQSNYMPLVSVIIPTYNRLNELKNAVQSVLQQTYQNFEILVINDNGEDISELIYSFNDNRIRIFYQKENKGPAAARNVGLLNAKGDYIAYLDDDDIYYNNHLITFIEAIKHYPNIKVFYTDAYEHTVKYVENKEYTISKKIKYSNDFSKIDFLIKNLTPTLCVFHESIIIKEFGLFIESMQTHEDWEYWLRISQKYDFVHIPIITCEFRIVKDKKSLTKTLWCDFIKTTRLIFNNYPVNNSSVELIRKQRIINMEEKLLTFKTELNYECDILVSIIIPVYNKLEFTQQCVKSLLILDTSVNFEIIVVDNASTDSTAEYLNSIRCSKLKVIKNSFNQGFAKANNQAVKIARGKYLILLNNDTLPTNDWLDVLVSTIEQDDSIGVVGAKLLYDNDTIQHCGVSLVYHNNKFRHHYKFLDKNHPLVNKYGEVDAVTAACFITRKDLYLELDGLDEKYLNGCEDIDYCCKVRQKGLKIIYQPKAEIYHYESQTPRESNNDDSNYNYFFNKWAIDCIKNEIEIYCEDGFWVKDFDHYYPVINEYFNEWKSLLEIKKKSIYNTIINRIYPVNIWKKTFFKKHQPLISKKNNFIFYSIAKMEYVLPFILELKKSFPNSKFIFNEINYVLLNDLGLNDIDDIIFNDKELTHILKTLKPDFIIQHFPQKDLYNKIRQISPNTKILLFQHGLADKNYTYNAKYMHQCDFYFVSNQSGEEFLKQQGINYCKNTGYIPLDYLFNTSFNIKSKMLFFKEYKLDINKKTIMYGPTWGGWWNYSSLKHWKKILNSISDEFNIIVKLHPNIFSEAKTKIDISNILSELQDYCFNRMNIAFIHDINFYPLLCLKYIDLLISDVSSIVIEALLLNKPVLTWNNHQEELFGIDKSAWEDSVVIDDKSNITNLINQLIIEEHYVGSKINLIIKENKDGRNAKKAVEMFNNYFFIKNPKKILFICHDFPPYRYAGAQLYARNLAKAINQSGLAEVEILHPVFLNHNKNVGDYEKVIYDDLVVHRIYKTPNVLDYQNVRSDLIFDFLNKFFEDNHYDLIHFHGLGQMSAVPIEVLSNKKIPMIMTLHDYWFLCDEWHLMTPDQRLCSGPDTVEKCTECLLKNHVEPIKRTELKEIALEYKKYRKTYLYEQYNKINRLYAPSNYLKNKFDIYGLKNIFVNPLGFIVQKTKEKNKSNLIRFGYAGQLIRRKGINTLVEAFLKINKPNVQLNIWGKSYDESFKNELFSMISDKSNIVYHGEYKPEDLPDIFANIDITVIPSLMENYPLLVQESYMFKTPVIASDAGGIPEAVTHEVNGLIFKAGNSFDLLEKMNQIIINPSLISSFTNNIPIVKDISEDAMYYANEYNEIINHDKAISKHILIYYFKNVHIPILKPITETLKQRGDIDLAVGYMHYAPEIRAGFTHEELEILKSYGLPMFEVPQDFKPDVTIIADSVYPWVKNCGKLINVGHGVLSKGQYYTNTETAKREELSDIVCVPGRYHKEMMEKIISKPVLATGMAKLDDLFSKKINRDTELQRLGLPKDSFYVLFAPTFNDELSAIPYVKDKIYEVLPDPNSILLIKLHGSTAQHYKDMYSQLNKIDKRVFYLNDLDITPYLAIADVLISDVSSVMMEFAALDKPVVLFNNPLQKTYKNYNSTDLEYTHRDIGYQVESLDEMKLAVLKLNRGIDPYKEKRKFITDMLFENKYTGQATQKIIETIMQI